MRHNPSISVIITTYNWPKALNAVLRSVCAQQYASLEIVVADDGSKSETKELIAKWSKISPYPIKHIWQEDKGFRAAMARNRAIAQASGDFIVFLDGDCVVPKGFIARYARLAQKGKFVSGNRVLLGKAFSNKVLENNIYFEKWSLPRWSKTWFNGDCNRILPLVYLPLGPFRVKAKGGFKGVKTCNLGVWREDLLQVNGLDEDYMGWGYEDSDLVIRLLRHGVQRKEGRFMIPVFHLWHQMQSRKDAKENFERLANIQNESRVKAVTGLDQYV